MYEPDVVTKYGMTTYFDYDEALAVARKLHKPRMLSWICIAAGSYCDVYSDPRFQVILC